MYYFSYGNFPLYFFAVFYNWQKTSATDMLIRYAEAGSWILRTDKEKKKKSKLMHFHKSLQIGL